MTNSPYCSVPDAIYQSARKNLILLTEVGSTVYGTGLPGHEDHDEMGVFILPPQDVLGVGAEKHDSIVWRTAGASAKSTPADTDLAMYSARKYVTLAAAGNPSILVPLFTQTEKIFEITQVGEMLRAATPLFVTKAAGHRFLGYMESQRSRMIDSRAGVRAPRTNRPALIAEHGFDTKFAMHMLRLGYQGIELLTNGKLVFPIDGTIGEYLRAVRRGEYEYDEVLERSYTLSNRLEHLIRDSDLPHTADYAKVNDLIWKMHWTHWDEKGLV